MNDDASADVRFPRLHPYASATICCICSTEIPLLRDRLIGIRPIDYKRGWYAVYLRGVDSDEVLFGQFMTTNLPVSSVGRVLNDELPKILSLLFKTDQSKQYITEFGRKPGDKAQGPEQPVADGKGVAAAPKPSKTSHTAQLSGNSAYLGCFRDRGDRDLKGYMFTSREMTGAKCIKICREKGFSYAGTQYRNQCFCGNSYGRYGKADNRTDPCAGNPAEKCGGGWANSIYRTAADKSSRDQLQ